MVKVDCTVTYAPCLSFRNSWTRMYIAYYIYRRPSVNLFGQLRVIVSEE